jgi:hypothetical protein
MPSRDEGFCSKRSNPDCFACSPISLLPYDVWATSKGLGEFISDCPSDSKSVCSRKFNKVEDNFWLDSSYEFNADIAIFCRIYLAPVISTRIRLGRHLVFAVDDRFRLSI